MPGPQGAVAKEAALLIERAIGFTIDTTDFHLQVDQVVSDFLRAGVGVPWVRYEAKVHETELGPEIVSQGVVLDHIPWSRFHWEPGKEWKGVDWIAIDHYLTKRELVEQFGKEPDKEVNSEGDSDDGNKYCPYRVTEVYYRPTRTVYVVGWQFDELLETRKDKLGLSGFYPCPRPMMDNLESCELTPKPDHYFNKASFDYINKLTKRIHSITAQIKVAGAYDASLPELANLTNVDDGTYVPIPDLLARLQNSSIADFNKIIANLPLTEKVEVVRELQALLVAEKQRLDEANGIADIVRGSTDPNETATAQQIKGNWASLRLSRKSGEVNRALRDAMRIMGEIMAEHFRPEQFYIMTGKMPTPEVIQVLKSDIGRTLSIDIETDSTIALDDEADKKSRLDFLNYIVPLYQNIAPLVQAGQFPADVFKATISFALRSFKHGRELEDALENAPDTQQQLAQLTGQLQQAQQQAQGLQQQNQQLQGQLQQAQGADAQAKVQTAQIKAQADQFKAGASVQKTQLDMRRDQMRAQIDDAKARRDFAMMQAGVPTQNVV